MGSLPDVYKLLKEELKDTSAEVLTPDSPGYGESIKRWSEHCEKRAKAVVKPTTTSDISSTLKFIRKNSIPFVVRGGGHSTSGSSAIEDGLVIDLSLMRKVTVDAEAKTVTAEGGTIWEDVDVEAAKYGLATVGGTVNHTGVGGLTLGGGYGYLSGRYGLTIDNLLSVEIVLASGELVTASKDTNPDLFWAVRGAGQNFGVVTSFTFAAYPQSTVYAGTLVFLPEKLPEIVAFANKFHKTNNGDQALLWGFSCPPPLKAPVVLTQIFYNGDEGSAKEFFADLFALGPVVNTAATVPYEQLNSLLNHTTGFEGRKQFGGGAFKLPLNPIFVQALLGDFLDFISARDRMNESMMLFECVPYKKVLEVTNEAMSFSNRGDYYNVATIFKWFDPKLDSEVREFSRSLLKKTSQAAGVIQDDNIRSAEGVGKYGNYSDIDVPADQIYGGNAKKLADLKHKYDPDDLFSRGTRLVPRPIVVVN